MHARAVTTLNVIGPVSRHERFARASPELFKTAPHHGGFCHDRSAVGIKTVRVIEVSGEVIVVKHAQGAVPRLAGGQAEAASRFLQPRSISCTPGKTLDSKMPRS